MQICRDQDTRVFADGPSFAPDRGLLARVTWGRGEWFLRCGPGLVAIHLGAPGVLRSARKLAPVLLLESSEIVVVRKESELLALSDRRGGFVRGAMVYVDLHLRHSRTEPVLAALAGNAPADPARQTLRVPQPGVLRLIWEGPYHRMRPEADAAVDWIRAAAGVSPEARAKPTPWHELSDEQLGDHILQLQEAGRYTEALEILGKRDGREEARATQYVHRPTTRA